MSALTALAGKNPVRIDICDENVSIIQPALPFIKTVIAHPNIMTSNFVEIENF